MDDPYDLQRFVDAQDAAGTYRAAVRELRDGRKRSHWMWFVFPQIRGLGHSATAERYAITSLAEAQAYLRHPVLGARIRECARLLVEGQGSDAVAVFGSVDAQKLQSSMTLFGRADPNEPAFAQVLERYFAGAADQGTTGRLSPDTTHR